VTLNAKAGTMTEKTMELPDVLKAWDDGEAVWSVEMGGIGPGYEQCIQLVAFEIVRDMLDEPVPPIGDTEAWEPWWDKADETITRVNRDNELGLSGAQAGAAKNIASVFIAQGYEKGLSMADDDRRILVHKQSPVLRDSE